MRRLKRGLFLLRNISSPAQKDLKKSFFNAPVKIV